jgi:hypothetical protein
VRHETHGRLIAYRYALEHLLIEAPQSEAVAAERTLTNLEVHRRTLDTLVEPAPPGMMCAGADAEIALLDPTRTLTGLPAQETIVAKD